MGTTKPAPGEPAQLPYPIASDLGQKPAHRWRACRVQHVARGDDHLLARRAPLQAEAAAVHADDQFVDGDRPARLHPGGDTNRDLIGPRVGSGRHVGQAGRPRRVHEFSHDAAGHPLLLNRCDLRQRRVCSADEVGETAQHPSCGIAADAGADRQQEVTRVNGGARSGCDHHRQLETDGNVGRRYAVGSEVAEGLGVKDDTPRALAQRVDRQLEASSTVQRPVRPRASG